MTKDQFHRLLVDPKTSDWLNRMLAENADVDARIAASDRERAERHDSRYGPTVDRYLRAR